MPFITNRVTVIVTEAPCGYVTSSSERRRADQMQKMHNKSCEVCSKLATIPIKQNYTGQKRFTSKGSMLVEQQEYKEAYQKMVSIKL